MTIKSKNTFIIDLIVDLHGFNLDEAFYILKNNLSASDIKRVLVITGKSGVMHNLVPRWITYNTTTFSNVKSIKKAPQSMGGSGAFIVTLKN